MKIQCALLEMQCLALGGLLVELSLVSRRVELDLSSRWVRVLTIVGVEPDAKSAPDGDQIDIYEFLRTYQPSPEDDSSDAQSEDIDLQLDEPYVLHTTARRTAARPQPDEPDPPIDL